MPWNMYVALPKTLGQIVAQDTTHCPASWPGPLPFRNPGELASAVIESSALLQRRELQLKATPWAAVNGLTNLAAGTTRFALRNLRTPAVPSLMRLIIGLVAVRRCSLLAKWRTGMRKAHALTGGQDRLGGSPLAAGHRGDVGGTCGWAGRHRWRSVRGRGGAGDLESVVARWSWFYLRLGTFSMAGAFQIDCTPIPLSLIHI